MTAPGSLKSVGAQPSPLVDARTCAAILGKSAEWVRKDRQNRKTIPFVRVAGSIRYDMARVMAVVMATEEGGTPRRA